MTTVLDKELDLYQQHREELLATAEGKYVLIGNGEVLGTFESEADAIDQGYLRLGVVPFLVKNIVRVEVPLRFHAGFIKF